MSATLVAPRPVAMPRVLPAASGVEGDGTRVFRVCLVVFIAVAVARMQEWVPGVAYFYLGKLITLPMVVATVAALPRWQVIAAMRTTPFRCVGVIVLFCALSVPFSVWPGNSAHFLVFVLIPPLLLFVATAAGFADRRTARICIVSLVLFAGADALYVASGLSPVIHERAYIGTGLDPNESAAFFVFALPFAAMLASERGTLRWAGLGIALALVVAIAKTGSRGGLVGLVVVGLVLVVQGIRRGRWAYVVALLAFAGAFSLSANEALFTRFRTILAPESDYNVTDRDGRFEIWKRGMKLMVTHPVVGIGLDGFETAEGTLSGKKNEGYGIRYVAAHNAFVQIGAELGVFGFAAFITAFASAAAGCRRAQRQRVRSLSDQREAHLGSALFCALIAIACTGFFLSFAYHPLTFFTLAASAGITASSRYATRMPPS